MGFFKKKPDRILPFDIGHHLAVYGEEEYAESARRNVDRQFSAIMALKKMQLVDSDAARARIALTEIVQAVKETGGWAIYGAPAAVHAFLPSQTDTPTYRQLAEARVRFLRAEGPPGWQSRLTIDDKILLRKLFPDEF